MKLTLRYMDLENKYKSREENLRHRVANNAKNPD